MNDRLTMAALTSVMGSPSKHLGGFASARRRRTPANSTMASMKPNPAPTAHTMLSAKLYPSSMTEMVTPSTAQLVVMSGRYTPSALYSGGMTFFSTISTSCTSTAIMRMNTMVFR